MSVSQDRLMYVFQCDTCLDSIETLETKWLKAVPVMLSDGWLAIKGENGKYTHKCAECVKAGK